MNNLAVHVSQRFTASPERVYDAWLSPEMLSTWMFGPALREEEIVSITLDARVGGSFSFVVRRNGELIDHVGEYLEMNRPSHLVFTWGIAPDPPTSRVMIDIHPLQSGCELKLTHEMESKWAEYAKRTEEGWTKMLGCCKRNSVRLTNIVSNTIIRIY